MTSAAILEQVPPILVSIAGTAHFVQYVVATDEQRIKFKPALLSHDTLDPSEDVEKFSFWDTIVILAAVSLYRVVLIVPLISIRGYLHLLSIELALKCIDCGAKRSKAIR